MMTMVVMTVTMAAFIYYFFWFMDLFAVGFNQLSWQWQRRCNVFMHTQRSRYCELLCGYEPCSHDSSSRSSLAP